MTLISVRDDPFGEQCSLMVSMVQEKLVIAASYSQTVLLQVMVKLLRVTKG